MAIDIGLWRSTLGDTHPHVGLDVAWDYWPQSTHLVWEASGLVGCFTGGGGGSQQALFKRGLDPILEAALERWLRVPLTDPVEHALDRYFSEIQHGFESADDEAQATGVAALITERGAAVGNVGLDRAFLWWRSDEVLRQLTADDSLAVRYAHQQHPEWFRHTSAAAFRRSSDGRPELNKWTTSPLPLHAGDLLLLTSGIGDTGLETAYLSGALKRVFDKPIAGAQDIADRLGSTVVNFAAQSPKEERTAWKIHSRLALAVVWLDK